MSANKLLAIVAFSAFAAQALAEDSIKPDVCVGMTFKVKNISEGSVAFECRYMGTKTIKQMYEAGYRIVASTQSIEDRYVYTTVFLESQGNK
ncbi:MAG: hypothetical protein Q8M09_08150 [Pseudomonadota bacterium]|nr:hypothetical protein [Pseudomonadota bacterium]MDP1904200.1 hypothetical protein [Pseudomonadota bacterium]